MECAGKGGVVTSGPEPALSESEEEQQIRGGKFLSGAKLLAPPEHLLAPCVRNKLLWRQVPELCRFVTAQALPPPSFVSPAFHACGSTGPAPSKGVWLP